MNEKDRELGTTVRFITPHAVTDKLAPSTDYIVYRPLRLARRVFDTLQEPAPVHQLDLSGKRNPKQDRAAVGIPKWSMTPFAD